VGVRHFLLFRKVAEGPERHTAYDHFARFKGNLLQAAAMSAEA
jgi:hypothetical protein